MTFRQMTYKQNWHKGWEGDYRTPKQFPPGTKFCYCGREFTDVWEESRHRLGKHQYRSWTKTDANEQRGKLAAHKR